MNNTLLQAMKSGETTQTENGALTYVTSDSAVLDFFANGGALRTRSEGDITRIFNKALKEDRLLALKALFYLADVRGGQGERRTFRTILKNLAVSNPDSAVMVRNNLANVAFFTRWDNLWVLLETPLKDDVLALVRRQLQVDLKALSKKLPVSLLAKWMSSENASSAQTRKEGRILRNGLEVSAKTYRKTLSKLRKAIRVVERDMCAGNWSEIDYQGVPSRAAKNYRNAFKKHDERRYNEFLGRVEKGEAKINASTLYPYDLVREVWNRVGDKTLDLQWKSLPNYLNGDFKNGLAVVDTSGSMAGLPIQIAISLGIYLGERIKGKFHNHFLTFSSRPKLQEIVGATLYEKVHNLERADWDSNTNVQAAFNLILNTAVRAKISQEEMPSFIVCVSDMGFDCACSDNKQTNFEQIQANYRAADYEMPVLIFWQVDSRSDQAVVKMDERGVILVSGCSPAVFSSVLAHKNITPYDQMIHTLSQERYDVVKI